MKFTLTFEGDTIENAEEMHHLQNATNLACMLHEIDEICRQRLKHGEDVGEKEAKILEEIREYATYYCIS